MASAGMLRDAADKQQQPFSKQTLAVRAAVSTIMGRQRLSNVAKSMK